jgi:MFS family permease
MSIAADPTPQPAARTGWASFRDLTGYQWFVLIVCCLAWDMDCLDQQLFVLARRPAMTELVPKVAADDPRLPEFGTRMTGPAATTEQVRAALRNADIASASTYATMWFMLGWATGGIGFGIMGDRYGRVKTLMLTILLYAAFTGLSALSRSTTDFYIYRFLTGLGVGGVFAAAATLLADTMPPNARPYALGVYQASSALGNCLAALISMWFGALQEQGAFADVVLAGVPMSQWRLMFVIGILPGLLVVFIQLRLKEPEKWRQAVTARGGKGAGSYADLFGEPRWRRHALGGLVLACAGVVGLWGIAFFSPDLQSAVAKPTYQAEARAKGLDGSQGPADRDFPPGSEAAKYVTGQTAYWAGITSLVQNLGAFAGIFAFSILTAHLGRKPTFALFLVLAGGSTALVFMYLRTWEDIFWMVPLMGFFQLALFGGYAIYLPELFPTRLRSTGTSFCYNVGRLFAAFGPFALGKLSSQVYAGLPGADPLRYAGVTMCGIFLLGLVVLPFLPETKGKPLPE